MCPVWGSMAQCAVVEGVALERRQVFGARDTSRPSGAKAYRAMAELLRSGHITWHRSPTFAPVGANEAWSLTGVARNA